MIPRIKICGLTRETDIQYAAMLGVDAIGFVFAESPRKVTQEDIRKLYSSIPPFLSTVGIFVDTDLEVVRQIATLCRLDWVQLHGKESPQYCKDLGLKVIKAVRVKDSDSIKMMEPYTNCVQGFVLDTYVKGQKGGTGKTFDWRLAEKAKKYGPVVLAGGLTPNDVGEAIRLVKPYGVDVSSGVESAPGIKDHDKMCRFVQQVWACTQQHL